MKYLLSTICLFIPCFVYAQDYDVRIILALESAKLNLTEDKQPSPQEETVYLPPLRNIQEAKEVAIRENKNLISYTSEYGNILSKQFSDDIVECLAYGPPNTIILYTPYKNDFLIQTLSTFPSESEIAKLSQKVLLSMSKKVYDNLYDVQQESLKTGKAIVLRINTSKTTEYSDTVLEANISKEYSGVSKGIVILIPSQARTGFYLYNYTTEPAEIEVDAKLKNTISYSNTSSSNSSIYPSSFMSNFPQGNCYSSG